MLNVQINMRTCMEIDVREKKRGCGREGQMEGWGRNEGEKMQGVARG